MLTKVVDFYVVGTRLIDTRTFFEIILKLLSNLIESSFYFYNFVTNYTIGKINNCVQMEIPFEIQYNIILVKHKVK